MFARMKTLSMVLCLVVVCLTLSATAMASDSDKKTIITTNQPLEIPGKVVLPAGKYVMKLVDLPSSRNVVQLFNADETKLYATVMGIPAYSSETPEKPEIRLYERRRMPHMRFGNGSIQEATTVSNSRPAVRRAITLR